MGCRAVPVRGDGGGGRRLGMGKVHGGEVGEGLVPREGQLLDRGRCCRRWLVQDGVESGFCFVL